MTTAVSASTDMAALRAQGAELIARDAWSRERLIAFQQDSLRSLIAFAARSSPYYRKIFPTEARNGNVALHDLPTLPKSTLVDEFDRIVTDPRIRLAELERHLRGPDPGASFEDAFHVFSTSGTTGLRALIVYDRAEFRFWVAVSLRLFARYGITPETRLAAIGAPNPLHITRRLFEAFRSGRTGAPQQLSVMTPIDEIVGTLNEYQPEAVLTYASIAALLAQEQLEGRLRIAPRIVGVSSEVLTDEARCWIGDAWQIAPVEVYAATETLYIGMTAPGLPGIYLNDDLAVVEVVDENNLPVPPGTPGFRVLVTNLRNRMQPLIRYEISDSITLAEGSDDGALPYTRLTAIDGRSDDILRFRATAGGDVAVHPYRLRAPFAASSELRQYQIIQKWDKVEVLVVLRPAASVETTARVRHALVTALEEAGAAPVRIDVVPVDAIPREPGHAAKLKLVKNLAHI